MTPAKRRFLLTLLVSAAFATFLAMEIQGEHAMSRWIYIPSIPGFLTAVFAIGGIHGGRIGLSFYILMTVVNTLCYTAIGYSILDWIADLRAR